MPIATIAEKGRLVVARFVDGRVLKGTTHDFAPNKTEFRLYERGDERSRAVAVSVGSLKAIFFVKSFEGDSSHQVNYSFERAGGQGRKMRVRFNDGELMAGLTMGYNAKKQGFFLIPADPHGNNHRVYVLNSAVAKFEWL